MQGGIWSHCLATNLRHSFWNPRGFTVQLVLNANFMAAHEMENRRIVGKDTHCKLDYLRGKDGSSRCGCHCCFLA